MITKTPHESLISLAGIYIALVERHSPQAADQLHVIEALYGTQMVCDCASLLMNFWHYHCYPEFMLDLEYYNDFCDKFATGALELENLWRIFYTQARRTHTSHAYPLLFQH